MDAGDPHWIVRLAAVLALAAASLACDASALQSHRSPMPGELLSTLDGISLSVIVEPNPLPRGEDVTFTASVRNDGGSAVDYDPGACAFADLGMSFPVPWEPTGRTWAGRQGWFKDLLLNHSYAAGGTAAWAPPDEVLLSTPCHDAIPPGSILQQRGQLDADFTRAVRNALQSNPHVSSVPFSITFNFDQQNDPPPIDPGFTGIPPRFFPIYRHLTAEGVLRIAGAPTDLLTAGDAIDRLLENDAFRRWVDDQPAGTCETANLDLDSLPGNGDAPGWFINLWCETGVPRHRGGAWVDAETGEIKKLEMCGDPCA